MLNWLSERAERKRNAHKLYGSIVALSRSPGLYAELHVPDTVEGRLEILILHMYLLLERLEGHSEQLAQDIVDRFFADMDTTSRELGAGDLAVPGQMRALAAVFRDRMAEYRAAAADPDTRYLAALINRTVYSRDNAGLKRARGLERYVCRLRRKLSEASVEQVRDGRFGAWNAGGGQS